MGGNSDRTNNRSGLMPVSLWLAVLALIGVFLPTNQALGVQYLSYSGRLTNANGSPMTGPVEIAISFYRAPTGGEAVGPTLQIGSVDLVQGVFTVDLKLTPVEIDTIFSNGAEAAFVEVTAVGKAYPRQRLLPIPLALRVPVDNSTVEFSSAGLLTVKSVPIAKVDGLSAILGASAALKGAAGSTIDGYLSKTDWQRFDGKQDSINSASNLTAGSLSTAMRKALSVQPYGLNPGNTGEVRFSELAANGQDYVGLKAPDAIATPIVWTLPATQGTNGQVLSTNSTGLLSWITPKAGTVTQITTGAGLTGGPVNVAGEISLSNTTVVPGYYPRASISVDAQGRITSANQSSDIDLTSEVFGILPINRGGTGISTSPTNGQLLIGNGTGYALTTLTEGTGIKITNSAGGIKIDATADASAKVSRAGDTMTGTLAVQGNIGIGTAAPNTALEVSGSSAALRISRTANSTDYSQITDSSLSAMQITKWSTDVTGASIDLNPSPVDTIPSAKNASVRLFRSTNTTGPVGLQIFQGDNSSTINSFLSGNGNSYFAAVTGNVGIGTTAPGAALDITGQIRIQGGSPGVGKVLTSDVDGLGSWMPAALISITGVTAGTGLTGGGTNGSVTLNADVGTTANKIVQLDAAAKLPSVDGSALTNLNPANLSAAVGVTKGGTGLTAGTSGGVPYFNANSTMASSGALTSNGVVLGGGAGAAPTSTSAGVANTVLRVPTGGGAPAFGAVDVSQSSAVTGALNVGNGGTGTSLLVTGGTGQYLKQTAVGAAVSVGAIMASDLPTMLGDSGAGGTKGAVPAPASGDSAAGKYLKADGTWGVPPGTTNLAAPGAIGSTTPNTGSFTTLTASGNVGIGSASPTQKLDVAGNINVAGGNSIFMGSAGVAPPGAGSNGQKIQLWGAAGSVGGSDYALGIENSNMWFNTGGGFKWYVGSALKAAMDSSGNLGLGISSPTMRLDVSGNMRSTGEMISTMGSGYGQSRYVYGNYGLINRNDGSNFYILVTASGDPYGTYNGLRPFTLNLASGDTTINGITARASGSSEFSGNMVASGVGVIRDSGGGWIRTYGNTGWYSETYGGGWYMTDTTWLRAYAGKNIYTPGVVQGDNTVQSNYLYSWGNARVDGSLGIGTSTPAAKLNVMDTISGLTTGLQVAPYHIPGVVAGTKLNAYDADGTTVRSLALQSNGGYVGIGTTAPGAKLTVSGGQAVGTFVSGSSSTIDWNSGNIQSTSAAAGTITFVANSMIDGGAYTLALSNATGGSYTFSSTGLTFKCSPACPINVTAGQHTVAAMIKAGSIVYVSWVQGFQ